MYFLIDGIENLFYFLFTFEKNVLQLISKLFKNYGILIFHFFNIFKVNKIIKHILFNIFKEVIHFGII